MEIRSGILLSPPHLACNELQFIKLALEQSSWASGGENLDVFEHRLDCFLGSGYSVGLSSGTAAIHLALIILDVKQGDEVLCQSFTFSASANPITYVGAKPVFIDSEPETWNMCPKALEEALKDRTAKGRKPKAIIVVHLYGMPAKMDEIPAVAAKYEIPLVEDAAEALGSTYKGQKCGTFGEMSVLSFNGNKIITTSGGGALICRNLEEKNKAVFLSTQARDNAPHNQHSEIGYNYRMSNISAGMGRGQMKVLNDRIEARRKNHQFYLNLFENFEGVTVFNEPNSDYFSNHWLSAIVIDEEKAGFNREQLRLALDQENIESRPLWKPMHLQPIFESAPYFGGNVAGELFKNGLCLPSGSNLNEEDLERIKNVILSFKNS